MISIWHGDQLLPSLFETLSTRRYS